MKALVIFISEPSWELVFLLVVLFEEYKECHGPLPELALLIFVLLAFKFILT